LESRIASTLPRAVRGPGKMGRLLGMPIF
jgi:hypothetical protein